MSEIQQEILSDNSEVSVNSKQIAILKKHFPQCFDKNGNFISNKLNEIVNDSGTEFSKESYGLNWLGKSYARLLANENPLTLLAEDKEHNQKPENQSSENLLIKGDNLEVLKHLKGAYSESIKMIYIDPPYNTGSDGFVYQDDRKFTPEQLSELAGIDVEEAQRILEFTQSKANSHSAWLTFMYPRLYIARDLLKDEGIIFISIDDNEVYQLKILCDQVFGESNYLGTISNTNNPKGRSDDKFIATAHEYILVYSRDISSAHLHGFEPEEKITKRYNKTDVDGRAYREIDLRKTGDSDRREDRPDMFYYFYLDECRNVLRVSKEREHLLNETEIKPIKDDGTDGRWRWGLQTAQEKLGTVYAKFMPSRKIWGIFEKDYLEGRPPVKTTSSWTFKDVNSERGSEQFIELGFSKEVFKRPKPIGTIRRCLEVGTRPAERSIVLDFFGGSGSTAQAVLELNCEYKRDLNFIMVQIPEICEEASEAYKKGYKSIFDVTKARIEKVSEKIRVESPEYDGDLGFKIFETLPVFDGYLDDIEKLSGETGDLFNGRALTDAQLESLLTTWKVYDGILLTKPLIETDLAGYKAMRHDKVLYLMHQGFKTDSLNAFLAKLDSTEGEDKAFDVEKIVLFGYNFDSKHQMEINDAVRQYKNRKGKTVSVVVRY